MSGSAWEAVLTARDVKRPTSQYFIDELFTNFIELHGDRNYRDDPSIIGGIALFDGRPVTVIAEEKGQNLTERCKRNFGLPYPEGYRKALRLMKQAEKFSRPIICLVDTRGAFCGIEAEERGQGEAIAHNMRDIMSLRTPIISVILSEGGSGGALSLSISDRVYILENAIYSILTPEAFAIVLWKDSSRACEAAEKMKVTTSELKLMGIVDEIIPEPNGGAKSDPGHTAKCIKDQLHEGLEALDKIDMDSLLYARYQRFRKF